MLLNWQKFRWLAFFLTGLFGIYLYLGNLDGALISYTDENRAFHFTLFSPLIYLICSPFTRLFASYSMPFYVMGFLGLLNVVLVYFLVKALFDKQIAILTSLFYGLHDIPLMYTKLLYYSTMIITLILLAMIFAILAERYRRAIFVFLAGICLGLMAMTSPGTYAVAIGVIIFMLLIRWMRIFGTPHLNLQLYALLVTFGIVITCVGIDLYCINRFELGSYFAHLSTYHGTVHDGNFDKLTGLVGLNNFFTPLYTRLIQSPSILFRTLLSSLAILAVILLKLRKSNPRFMCLIVPFISMLLIIIVSCAFKIQTLQYKYFVWLAVPANFCLGFATLQVYKGLSVQKRLWFIALPLIYLLLSGVHATQIIQSISSKHHIEAVLAEHNISKSKVATTFPLSRFKEELRQTGSQNVPVFKTNDVRDHAQGIFYRVHWIKLYVAYKNGWVTHFISSGYGHFINLGRNDLFLKGVEPIAEWPHPVKNPLINLDPHAFATHGAQDKYQLYALSEVFSHPVAKSILEKYGH